MNKDERNAIVERRYDELRAEGKHGHYECMFRVVHEIVDAELARVRDEYCALLMELQCREKDLARVREELAKQERLSVDIVNGHRAVVERVARRAASIVCECVEGNITKEDDERMISNAVAQAMKEIK